MSNEQSPRVYSQTQFKVLATHPETGEEVVVISSKFENSLSAVCGALGRLGIEFRQVRVESS